MTSTSSGFLPPRMTTTQKNAINSPTSGMLVYDITLSGLSVYNGSAWVTVSNAGTAVDPAGLIGAFPMACPTGWLEANGTSATALGNSLLFDGGAGIGIGNSAPKSSLDVSGGMAVGTYAGVTAAPSNSLIVSGNVGGLLGRWFTVRIKIYILGTALLVLREMQQ